MNFIITFINKYITPDDIKEMEGSLRAINEASKDNPESSPVKTNNFLRLLNVNIVKLSYATTLYSKCLLLLTFFLFILTVVMLFRMF